MIAWWIVVLLVLVALIVGYRLRAEVELFQRSQMRGGTLDFTRKRIGT